MHFFNPVPLMALVEIIRPGQRCRRGAVCSTPPRLGQDAGVCQSTPGFIVNRVARPYYAEACACSTSGPRSRHHRCRDARSRRFSHGPFELMDLIGHDVNFAVTQSVFQAYFNDPRFRLR
jgi:3-hydroxybutyryl-CoA dehydrogenase